MYFNPIYIYTYSQAKNVPIGARVFLAETLKELVNLVESWNDDIPPPHTIQAITDLSYSFLCKEDNHHYFICYAPPLLLPDTTTHT